MLAPIDPLLNLDDLAHLTGFHEEVLRRNLRAGRGPRHIRLGNQFRFRRGDVDEWLRAHEREGAGVRA